MNKISFYGKILIFDNNVLIYLIEGREPQFLYKLFNFLSIQYNYLIIPKTVRDEFFRKNKKTNKTIIEKLQKRFTPFIYCPIDNESDLPFYVGTSKKDRGEADGLLQTKKILHTHKKVEEIYFVTNDNKIKIDIDVPILRYKDFKRTLNNYGFTL